MPHCPRALAWALGSLDPDGGVFTPLTACRRALSPSRFAPALALLGAVSASPDAAAAQDVARAVRLTADNDYFTFWVPPARRADDNYTHGARVAWNPAGAPGLARRLVCPARRACAMALEVGQEMYTPVIDAPTPVSGERPYAGWLYARPDAVGADRRRRRTLALTVGVTGPAALAGTTQTAIHRQVPRFRQPLGWAHQLPTELTVAIRAEQAWRIAGRGMAGRLADLLPSVDAVVGTPRTLAGAAVRARAGVGLAHPWLAPAAPGRLAAYAFVGARGEAVAHDLFLDGSTFRRSTSVARSPAVVEWERGAGLRVGRLALEYRAATRSREYETGRRSHSYGTLGAAWVVR